MFAAHKLRSYNVSMKNIMT